MGIEVRENGRVEQRVPCPRCDRGPRDEALGVNTDTGAFHCFRCGWSGRAGTGETRVARPIERLDDPAVAERKRERLRRTWSATVPLSDPAARPVRQYLAARRLADIVRDPPQILRAHPALAYYDGHREVGLFPAMVCLFADKHGDGVTLHATYLNSDGSGKAPVRSPKKLLGVPVRGATRGGAIRLYPPKDGVLGVAEGIESALSLRFIQRIPTWATYCAANMEALRVPQGLKVLYIGVDIDENGKGESSARALANRLLQYAKPPRIKLVLPDGQGPRDLNDELRNMRAAG
jgi:hypothetical protein